MSVGSLVVLLAVLPAGPPPAVALTSTLSPADEQTLKSAHVAVSEPALLDFLQKRSGPAADKAEIAGLVKQLADAASRDAAAGRLVALGEPAVPLLREAANNLDDPDSAARARGCLQDIEGSQSAAAPIAVVHAVAALKPPGGAEALLQYLPYSDNEQVEQEVEAALAAVTLRDGKPEPAVVRALTDPTPIRRAAAAVALYHVGGGDQLAAVRGLLNDPKPTVRFRVALALAESDRAEGVPVLIDLLADLPTEQRKQAEEYLTNLAGEWAVAGPAGNDAASRRLRRDAWAAWWRGMDDKVLLDEFKTRTMSDEERDQALALIQKLDDASADVRQQASADLTAMGLRVAPLLRQAAAGPDPRVGPFALGSLQLIEQGSPNPLPTAAGRLLALRAPEGAVAVLLAYLPYADGDAQADQLRDLLVSLAAHDAKAVPALVKALDDKVGVRRGAAAVALVRRGAGDALPAVKKLFRDADPDVRLPTALAVLTVARDRDAVPVLIDLLKELPPDRVWRAEEALTFLAGPKAPGVSVVGDAEARKKASAAWASWWAENNASIDLTKLDFAEQRELGYLLVVENMVPGKPGGRVAELDAAGKVRWEIEGVNLPQDARMSAGDRVLIIDNNGQRVCERETTGDKKTLWEKNVNAAFRVQHLPNGDVFIACRNGLLELDRNHNEVFNQLRNNNETILDAQKMRDGQIEVVTYQGNYTRLDAQRKEVKTFHVPFNFNLGVGGGEVLPNDHVLIASPNTGKVYEYDADGKTVLEGDVTLANNFFRLPNGHTLATCQNQTRVVELDAAGKLINEMKDLVYRPWRVSRR